MRSASAVSTSSTNAARSTATDPSSFTLLLAALACGTSLDGATVIVTVAVADSGPSHPGGGPPQLSGSPRSVTLYVKLVVPLKSWAGVNVVAVAEPSAAGGCVAISYVRSPSAVSRSSTKSARFRATGVSSLVGRLPGDAVGVSLTGLTVIEMVSVVDVSVPSHPGGGPPQSSGSPRSMTLYVKLVVPLKSWAGVNVVAVAEPSAAGGCPTISYVRSPSAVSTSATKSARFRAAGVSSLVVRLPGDAVGVSLTGRIVIDAVAGSESRAPSEAV